MTSSSGSNIRTSRPCFFHVSPLGGVNVGVGKQFVFDLSFSVHSSTLWMQQEHNLECLAEVFHLSFFFHSQKYVF